MPRAKVPIAKAESTVTCSDFFDGIWLDPFASKRVPGLKTLTCDQERSGVVRPLLLVHVVIERFAMFSSGQATFGLFPVCGGGNPDRTTACPEDTRGFRLRKHRRPRTTIPNCAPGNRASR